MKKILMALSIIILLTSPVLLQAGDAELASALRLFYQKDYLAAVDAFKQIISEEPQNAAAYYYLGYTYQEMGSYPAAREAFRKTYEINPDFVPQVSGQ